MKSNPRNVARLNYSSMLLTMIFSMGEPMPITHFGTIYVKLVSHFHIILICYFLNQYNHTFRAIGV